MGLIKAACSIICTWTYFNVPDAGSGKDTASQAVLPGAQGRFHTCTAVISLMDGAFSVSVLLKAFPLIPS